MLKNSKGLKAYDYSGACSFYLCVIVLTLVCQAFAGVLSAMLAPAYPDIAKSGEFNTAYMVVVQVVNAAFIYFYTRSKRNKFDFTFVYRDGDGAGLTALDIVIPAASAFVLMAAMYLPTVWYGYMMRVMGLPADFGQLELKSAASITLVVIASVFLAPAMEETVYRGVLMHGIKREKSVFAAVMMSALAFMLMHMNPVQVVFQFALGVTAGFMAIYSGRLITAIITHAAANALALVAELTPLSGALAGSVDWLTNNIAAAVFITLGLMAAGGAILYFGIKYGFKAGKSHENAQISDDVADGDAQRTAEARKEMSRSDGSFKYFIGIGLCAVMLIVNLVVGIVS